MGEIVVLGTQGFYHHVQPLVEVFKDRVRIEIDYSPEKIASYNPCIVVTFEASNPQRGLCTAEMMRRNIATLLIMDGIQEWRNTWSRMYGKRKRPLNQPALVHKIACLGGVDARLYESWGNVGKCEIVGAPRLDKLLQQKKIERTNPIEDRPLRLLVMTARTPGFTPQETEVTLNSLIDLKDILDKRNDIEVVWRISKGLHLKLGVSNTYSSATGKELHELLPQMDAVITTPSTAQLEAMLLGIPVAILNYHFVPLYTPGAWEIKCKQHLETVINDLFSPPLERMIYQNFCLNDSLRVDGPAMPRVIQLIEEMIEIKKDYDKHKVGNLEFPPVMVPSDFTQILPSQKFNLEKLYPDHPVFGNMNTTILQSELDSALISVEQLKDQVDTLTKRLHKIPGYLFFKKIVLSIQKRFFLGGHSKV